MSNKSAAECLIVAFVWLLAVRACVDGRWARAQVLHKKSFLLEYNSPLGIPSFVSWAVTPKDLGSVKRTPTFRFKTDGDTPRPRITSALYTRSGYQRGHMCPAGDRSATKEDMKATFVMSNVCPMTAGLNTGSWKRVENFERSLALTHGRCSVIAAPLFYPQDTTWIGRHRVAVPHAFLKVLFDSNPSRLYGMYVMNNE